MPELNEQQKQAVNFQDGVAIVIAVPGSGKTLTMTQRIHRLIHERRVPPENILGLTFTRNAANAMRARLGPVDRAASAAWITAKTTSQLSTRSTVTIPIHILL